MQVASAVLGYPLRRARTPLAALLLVGVLMAAGLAGPARLVPAAPVVSAAPSVGGPIGGYVEAISSAAFDVESSGRIHVVWTGKLNPSFADEFTYYSTSTDGVSWTPYQILEYYAANQPRVAVDDARHVAHLVYRGHDGIAHRIAANGTVSAPKLISGVGWVTAPTLAVDPTTGKAFVSWGETYMEQKTQDSWQGKQRSWYSVWNGTSWATPWRVIHDGDTANTLLAAGPGPNVMLAWFQGWTTTVGSGMDAGRAAILRSAYSADGTTFAVRQQTNTDTTAAPKDNGFLLAASADGKFYMLTNYIMWPGHGISRRYVWSGEAWSAPMPVSDNTADWATPVYVGSAGGTTYYVYRVSSTPSVQWLRSESTPGALSTKANFDDVIASTGLSGASAMRVRAGGKFDFVGPVTGQAGVFYARQP